MVQQAAKWFESDGSLPDVLMPVEFRSARGFRVIAMPDGNILQADRLIQMSERGAHPSFADDVVSGNVDMAGVDAGSDWNDAAQAIKHFGNLLETASQGELCTSGIFNQNGEAALRQIQSLSGGRDCGCGLQQTGFAVCAAK